MGEFTLRLRLLLLGVGLVALACAVTLIWLLVYFLILIR